jgi:hypothetical protein
MKFPFHKLRYRAPRRLLPPVFSETRLAQQPAERVRGADRVLVPARMQQR